MQMMMGRGSKILLTSYEYASLVLVRLEVGAVEGVLGEPAVGHAQLRVGPVLGPVQPEIKFGVGGGWAVTIIVNDSLIIYQVYNGCFNPESRALSSFIGSFIGSGRH